MGQRRGLGIAAGEPLYVIATDPARQLVVVGHNDQLLVPRCFASGVNWISIAPPAAPVAAAVKIRNKHAAGRGHAPPHRRPPAPRASKSSLTKPQRAVTPGQGAVFYAGDLVLGGGWIETPENGIHNSGTPA